MKYIYRNQTIAVKKKSSRNVFKSHDIFHEVTSLFLNKTP